MTRIYLPHGIRLLGEVRGKIVPLWIESDQWGGEYLFSVAGEVASEALILLEVVEHVGAASHLAALRRRLARMGYRRVELRNSVAVDYQI